jgi:hypothetical protein
MPLPKPSAPAQLLGDIMFPGWAKVAKKRSWEHIENKGPGMWFAKKRS